MMTDTTNEPSTILVLGGTGKTGRRVAARLRSRGHAVRIGSRSGHPHFDWQDKHSWGPVLADVTAVYMAYAPDAGLPGAAETIGAFATAAARGVQRLVLLTGRGQSGAQLSEHAVQQAVQQAGTEWTILRSSFFAQDFSEDEAFADSMRSGLLAFPWGQAAEPFVDIADVADVATAALTEDGHAGHIYELTGPRLLTFAEAATEIAAASGREIPYLPITEDQFMSGLIAQGAPAEFAAQLIAMFSEVLDGRNAHLTDGIRQALGREPRDITDYILETATTGAWTSGAITSSN